MSESRRRGEQLEDAQLLGDLPDLPVAQEPERRLLAGEQLAQRAPLFEHREQRLVGVVAGVRAQLEPEAPVDPLRTECSRRPRAPSPAPAPTGRPWRRGRRSSGR